MFHTPSTSGSPGRQARYSSGPFLSTTAGNATAEPCGDQPIDQRPRIEFGLERPIDAERDPRPLGSSARSAASIFFPQSPALGGRHRRCAAPTGAAAPPRRQALSSAPSHAPTGQNKPGDAARPRSTSMLLAAGTRGRPGIVMMSPQIATTNSAPADSRTSRTASDVAARRPLGVGVGGKAVLGLGDAHREMAEALPPATARSWSRTDLSASMSLRAVDPLRDRADLFQSGISSG